MNGQGELCLRRIHSLLNNFNNIGNLVNIDKFYYDAPMLQVKYFPWVCALVLATQSPGLLAQTHAQKNNFSALTQVVSSTTASALSSSYLSSMLGGMGVFRWRIGEGNAQDHELGGLTASAEESPWSVWGTPVRSSFDNNIAPITSRGYVSLAIAGLEYRDDGPWMGGLSLSLDNLSAQTTYNAGQLTGHGYTLAPYLVYQASPTRAFDFSYGRGVSNLSHQSAGVTSQPRDRRMLASMGVTDIHEVGKTLVMLKASYSVISDKVASFTSSDGTVNDATNTRLNQTKLGGQWMYPIGNFSPFVAYYKLLNDFSATGGLLQPREYSATGQYQLGLNASAGDIFGALVAQYEKDRKQLRAYVGIRY